MSTKLLLKRWKNKQQQIKEDQGAETLQLLCDIRNFFSVQLQSNIYWTERHKMRRCLYNCDTVCHYIIFLEKHLHETIRILKLAQKGFDERNKTLKLN